MRICALKRYATERKNLIYVITGLNKSKSTEIIKKGIFLNIFTLHLSNIGLTSIKKKDIILEYIKECYLKSNFNIFV